MRIRTPEQVGQLIADVRRERRLTQSQLADSIGASRFWVSEVERGKATAEVGLVLAALLALGVTLEARLPEAAGAAASPTPEPSAGRPALTRGGKPLGPAVRDRR